MLFLLDFRIQQGNSKFSEKHPNDLAVSECARLNSIIATVHSERTKRFLTSFVSEKSIDHWIGLYKDGDSEFYWNDGSAVDFTAWAIGYPTNHVYKFSLIYFSKNV